MSKEDLVNNFDSSKIVISDNLSDMHNQLNDELPAMLDKCAPVRTLRVSAQNNVKWVDKEVFEQTCS